MEEISLQELWFIVRKNMLFIIAVILVAMIIASLVSFFVLDKEYESYTTLMLGKPKDYAQDGSNEITYNDILVNQKLVSTYGEIAKSKAVTSKVVKNLLLDITRDITPGQLGNMITVSTVRDTEIIKITVKYTDPALAARISNEMAVAFMDYVSDLLIIDNVQIIDVAEVNTNPISPNVKMNIAISFVLGLMVAVFVVFLRETLDTTIKTPKEVEDLSELPILAIIPKSDLLG